MNVRRFFRRKTAAPAREVVHRPALELTPFVFEVARGGYRYVYSFPLREGGPFRLTVWRGEVCEWWAEGPNLLSLAIRGQRHENAHREDFS